MSNDLLNQRARAILKILIEHYIEEGVPIGSEKLARCSSLDVSSATIRNVMAELEGLGYLVSPHTSAGRIPTAQGYRFFVNSLLTIQPLDEKTLMAFQKTLQTQTDTKQLFHITTQLLSRLTHLAAIITLPRVEKMVLKYIEFLSLPGKRILVILVLNDHTVQNRVISCDRNYKDKELEQAANYLNQHFSGKDLKEIRRKLFHLLQKAHSELDNLMRELLTTIKKDVIATKDNQDYLIAGKTNLLGMASEKGVDHLRSLFDAFTEKQGLLELLDKCLNAEGLQIFIGEESGHELLADYSMITSPYLSGTEMVGVVGVIGPSRMPYEKVISVVDATAKILSEALN